MVAKKKVSKKNTSKKVSIPKKKIVKTKTKPKKKVSKIKPAWIITMNRKPEESPVETKPLAELPPPIPEYMPHLPAMPVNLEISEKQLDLPLTLPVEVTSVVPQISTPVPVIQSEPVAIASPKKTTPKLLPTKKVYSNIDLFKSLADKALGCVVKTALGGLAVGGFVGLLQFCTKLSETGMPLKNVVIFTITSYLVGTLLD